MDLTEEISKILLNCENEYPENKYIVNPATYAGTLPLFKKSTPEIVPPVEYKCTAEEEIFIVSDLHISSGRNKSGVYPGTENFFADNQFSRFLEYAHNQKKSERAILIINGDVLDFLRVTEYPGSRRKFPLLRQLGRFFSFRPLLKYSDQALIKLAQIKKADFNYWEKILKKVGLDVNRSELEILEKNEKTYGLGTNNYKSIWKLDLISKGHSEFFKSLSDWIKKGNKIFIVKGNHDLEWSFLAVRNYFRLLMAEIMCGDETQNMRKFLTETVIPNIHFFDDSLVIDGEFYLEHGHRYDKFTFVLDNPFTVNSKTIKPQNKQTIRDQLNIPFGSFFNRYIINRIELLYPYADNIKPASNIFPIMIRERLSVALRIFGQAFILLKRLFSPGTIKYVKFMFARFFLFFLICLLALGGTAYFIYKYFHPSLQIPAACEDTGFIDKLVMNAIKYAGLLLLSYLLSRIVSSYQLSEPESLADNALDIFRRNSGYKIITMGHTHNPSEYVFADGRRFYNTGTWIPIIETSSAEIREDKTYTFLHLIRSEGMLQPANDGLLQRWNDDAGREEPLVITQRK